MFNQNKSQKARWASGGLVAVTTHSQKLENCSAQGTQTSFNEDNK